MCGSKRERERKSMSERERGKKTVIREKEIAKNNITPISERQREGGRKLEK